MAAIDFTPEQREAIERRAGPLFLHAGAGSGKTAVLVERFVAAARDDEIAVDRILAITFTDKAAAELKSRIRARFLEEGEPEQARAAEAAWVSTIHGFCSRVLRTHPLEAGIDPDYRVLEQPEADRLERDAFELALEDFLGPAEQPERVELAATYTPEKLERMLRAAYSRLRSRGQAHPALPELPEPRPAGEPERLAAAIQAALRELGGESGAVVEAALHTLEGCDRALSAIPDGELAAAGDFEQYELRGNAKALKTPAIDELAQAHAAYVKLCSSRRQFADQALLGELLTGYGRRYDELKRDRSALDFEDLQLFALELLRSDEGLLERYREQFALVMVDEFQDTNPLQVALLECVARENLFTVGDEAQSIYLFRNADVGKFRELREAAASRGQTARLTANFRTRGEILGVLNAAFTEVFEGDFQELAEPPGASRGEAPASPSVELLVADSKRERWGALGDAPFGDALRAAPPWRAAEARLLARRIDELTRSGPFEFGDVAVLLRAAGDMAVYERALEERGIPTYAAGGQGFWDQQQVADLRSYLAALANPLDEAALYTLLATPLVGVSLDALAIVATRARGASRSAWWALEEAFLGDGCGGLADALAEEDRARLGAFAERFAAERRSAARLSLETLVDRAVTQSGYDRLVLAMPAGARRMANVRKLMRLARRYEAEEGRDLRGFVDFLAERDDAAAREGEAPLEGEDLDAVRLMTIHGAKGLEFDVVCVADLGRGGRGDDDALRVTDDGRVGLALAKMGGGSATAGDLEEIKTEEAEAQEAEERRIFYVAMTRAREHLVLSGAVDLEKWPPPRRLCPPMDWIWRALAPDLPGLAGASAVGESVREAGGGTGRVGFVVCSPQTVDEVLPAPDRAPEPAPPGATPPESLPPLPEATAVEAASSPPVSRISYSALQSYGRCGYRFYAERVLRLRPLEEHRGGPAVAPLRRSAADGAAAAAPTGPRGEEPLFAPDAEPDAAGLPPLDEPAGLDPLLRGTVVHELLERLDMGTAAVPSAEEVGERIASHGAHADSAAVEDVRALIDGFAASALRERLGAAEAVRRELAFAFALPARGGPGSFLVNGAMDVHALEDGGALVVDYKSDALSGEDPARLCERAYSTQRLVYALAALRAGAARVEVVYSFLERPDEPVSTVFEAGDADRLERELLALAAGIADGRFAPTESPHRELCVTCPARPALCSWGPERTLADPPQPAPAA